jgi:hypothetical protein
MKLKHGCNPEICSDMLNLDITNTGRECAHPEDSELPTQGTTHDFSPETDLGTLQDFDLPRLMKTCHRTTAAIRRSGTF